MLRTLLLLAMAYGVRRNEANGDCPGFKGLGVCEWGATRQSDGRRLRLRRVRPDQPPQTQDRADRGTMSGLHGVLASLLHSVQA